MSLKDNIRWQIDQSHWIANAYVQDLTDADFMMRPVPGMNHIAWQMGHLISSSHKMLGMLGQPAPALPAGFDEAYAKGTSESNDPAKFATKEIYLELAAKIKDASLAAVEAFPEDKLDAAAPEPVREYAPTNAALLTLLGTHWMMHCGQFVAVRRKLSKPALF